MIRVTPKRCFVALPRYITPRINSLFDTIYCLSNKSFIASQYFARAAFSRVEHHASHPNDSAPLRAKCSNDDFFYLLRRYYPDAIAPWR